MQKKKRALVSNRHPFLPEIHQYSLLIKNVNIFQISAPMDGPSDTSRLSINIQRVSDIMTLLIMSPPRIDDATMASLNTALWAAMFDRLLANMDPNALRSVKIILPYRICHSNLSR